MIQHLTVLDKIDSTQLQSQISGMSAERYQIAIYISPALHDQWLSLLKEDNLEPIKQRNFKVIKET